MTCTNVQPLLEAFADHDLSALTHWRVRRHLFQCPACTAELAEINALTARVRDWQNVPAPAGLGDRLAARLPAAAPVPARPPLRRTAVGLAGFAAALAAAFWLVPGQPGRPTVTYADVVKAMESVNTIAYIDNTLYYGADGKVKQHRVDQQWVRRIPPAVSTTNLLLDPSEISSITTLEDARGTLLAMPDGSYRLSGASQNVALSAKGKIDFLTQWLSFMANGDKRFGKTSVVEGEQVSLDGKSALKFKHIWHRKPFLLNAVPRPQRQPALDLETTVWIDPVTHRLMRLEGRESEDGKLVSSGSEYGIRYDEAPPSGVFDIVPPPGAKLQGHW